MQVSHESPLVLQEQSRSYNDYDYALVHLFEKHPEYFDFFIKSKEMGRKVLLDNSMFELREAFEPSKFSYWIDKLQPDEYIVPDVFIDSNATIENFKMWCSQYNNKGKKIGVVQGSNYQELSECYRFMSLNADKIAISFECPYFANIGYVSESPYTKWHLLASGRYKFVKNLIDDGLWAWHKPHHLLGCALPQEFRQYTGIVNIESIDTSNPVVAGIHHTKYEAFGLNDKIPVKLADLMNAELNTDQIDVIMYNIKKFREINHI